MSGQTSSHLGCAEFRRNIRADRRSFLKAGLLGSAGLSLANLLRAEAANSASSQPHTSVIILWMRGGPSHIDMWDLKPDAPAEYRGEFRPIETTVPGIHICEHLPRSAALMEKWSIIRSLNHSDPGHSSGDQLLFTGYPTGRIPEENIAPSCGAVVSRQLGHLNPTLPSYVAIPKTMPGMGAAYLGAQHQPFETIVDPAIRGPFRLPDFTLDKGLSLARLASRRELVRGFDALRRDIDQSGQMTSLDTFDRQAAEILTSSAARDAFDLDREPSYIRERYGITDRFNPRMPAGGGLPGWNQRILLARRLVEAGVRLVTVDVRWWDTHQDNFYSLRAGFLPRWDQAYSALIEDLSNRGLLESTLVVAWGEFGRSPKISPDAGRDHYPFVFSAALAGGPVKGGRVIGASDTKAAFPARDPHSPQDVLATIYRHLGVDSSVSYLDYFGRPRPVLQDGTPVSALF
ncbi:MAG: DUF1501 domain-containing protein [Planctomycetales bacterium]